MLIRFTVENFLSFKDEIEFSMMPGKTRKHKDHIYVDKARRDIRLLKTGVIYGPNASGKTNLIKAMDFAQKLIVGGTRANQSIPAIPYLLDRHTETRPSKFFFEIKIRTKAFAYGFEVDAKRIHSEVLYEIRPSTELLLFKRSTDDKGNTAVEFGSFRRSKEQSDMFLDFTAIGTRENQLFLTESIERNIGYFSDVYDWFHTSLVLIFTSTVPGPELGAIYLNNVDNFQAKYRDLIQLYDLDIEDIDLIPLDTDVSGLFSDQDRSNISSLASELPEDPEAQAILYNPQLKVFVLVDKYSQLTGYRFVTVHHVKHEDRRVQFELSMESDGTIRLFELTPALIRLLSSDEDTVFVVDELDRSLHAEMTSNILDIFLANSIGKQSQLIVTTHEYELLDLDFLRRDEVWFIAKDSFAASAVISLEEYAPRFDTDVKRGYRAGRYGSLPILPSYNIVDWAK